MANRPKGGKPPKSSVSEAAGSAEETMERVGVEWHVLIRDPLPRQINYLLSKVK